MVLLDSEGIDAASSVGYDDNQIFTLTVLLASVLIYNSQGVPTRRDLEGLEYPLLTLLYIFSLSLIALWVISCFVNCLFAPAFLGGDKSIEKGWSSHTRAFDCGFILFHDTSLSIRKDECIFHQVVERVADWQTFETYHFCIETTVGKYLIFTLRN